TSSTSLSWATSTASRLLPAAVASLGAVAVTPAFQAFSIRGAAQSIAASTFGVAQSLPWSANSRAAFPASPACERSSFSSFLVFRDICYPISFPSCSASSTGRDLIVVLVLVWHAQRGCAHEQERGFADQCEDDRYGSDSSYHGRRHHGRTPPPSRPQNG